MPVYPLDFTSGGTPTGALTPAITVMRRVSDGVSLLPGPAITEVGDGCYKFTYEPTADVYIVVDGGGILPAGERYNRLVVTPDDAVMSETRMIELLALAGHSFVRFTNHAYDASGNLTAVTFKGYASQGTFDADTPAVTKQVKITYDVTGKRSSFSQATTNP